MCIHHPKSFSFNLFLSFPNPNPNPNPRKKRNLKIYEVYTYQLRYPTINTTNMRDLAKLFQVFYRNELMRMEHFQKHRFRRKIAENRLSIK